METDKNNINKLGEVKMENKELINAEKLKLIFKDVFKVFEKHELTHGEIEFVISDLNKIAKVYSDKQMEKL